jgi:hypothetical protein
VTGRAGTTHDDAPTTAAPAPGRAADPVATLLLTITTLPLWLIVAALVAPRLPGRLRALRILSFLIVVLVTEALTVIGTRCALGRRGLPSPVRSGPRARAAHYWLMRVYLADAVLVGPAACSTSTSSSMRRRPERPSLDVDAALHEGEDLDRPGEVRAASPALVELWSAARPGRHPVSEGRFRVTEGRPARPLLVFSRHAGPGDSLLLVHALLQQGFRPHIVLRDALQWAPAIDIALNRLPSLFLSREGDTGRQRTQAISATCRARRARAR